MSLSPQEGWSFTHLMTGRVYTVAFLRCKAKGGSCRNEKQPSIVQQIQILGTSSSRYAHCRCLSRIRREIRKLQDVFQGASHRVSLKCLLASFKISAEPANHSQACQFACERLWGFLNGRRVTSQYLFYLFAWIYAKLHCKSTVFA